MHRPVRRGDIYRIALGDTKGHKTRGSHYAVVVQADLYNVLSTALVVPLSSSVKRPAPFHVPLQVLGKRTYALVEQLRAVDVNRRLKEHITSIIDSGIARRLPLAVIGRVAPPRADICGYFSSVPAGGRWK
ncbi:type II toxin-antitoxin system PemK/MazF family toxin [Candidatus Desulforudis audaxviator]|uniref:Transcriptional modulator of MazE/toxin, MazF n=1 Tax=Desulforudis audaxviator (strain MP104C) TaxID=477974 RepID=B1I6K1_DESAP|nr:transcriptional modulator of MazE/toxin, MazF [Candidatus Desulforudis audaxviator MP104C]